MALRTAAIHTSDRSFFKGCRRRWNWQSPLRMKLERKERVGPLWFGTGWHYILEDFHGYNLYETMYDAWDDYVQATTKYYGADYMPIDLPDLNNLATKMIEHYYVWLPNRDPLQTYWHNGVPQVEVNFKVKLPINPELLEKWGYDEVYYGGTIDRVIIDQYGSLWVGEYKSAKQIRHMHFMADPQITAYCWAAPILYGLPFQGCNYMQWGKYFPDEPRVLKNGTLSLAKNQNTTHALYRQALIDKYGTINRAPSDYVEFLNYLADTEELDNDGYIRRDWIDRSPYSLQAEGAKILMETEDMLNPDLPLYPTPTDRCSSMCNFYDACTALDNGDDWEELLAGEFEVKPEERGRDEWRKYLEVPHKPQQLNQDQITLEQLQDLARLVEGLPNLQKQIQTQP